MTKGRRGFGFDRYSGLYLWGLFIVVFGFLRPDTFLTAATAQSVAAQQAIAAMLALALLIPMATGVFDLSVGATANLSAVTVAVLQTQHGWGMWQAIGAGIAVGAVVGVLNGLVVVKLRVSSFIATLGMASIAVATQQIVAGNAQPLPPAGQAWRNLTQNKVGGFQIIVLYMLALAILAWWLLDHTPAGRYIYAVGGNAEAARLAGVKTDRWIWLSLIASGAIAGVVGVLYCSLTGPSLTFGPALLLPAFAAVFLGSTQLKPGRFNVWGSVLAIYVLATGVKGLQLITGEQWLAAMFNGVALIAAVAFAVWRQSPRARNSRKISESDEPATVTDTDAFQHVDRAPSGVNP